jgi:hypothetical protein
LGEAIGDTPSLHDGQEGLGLAFIGFGMGRVIDCSWIILQTMGALIPSAAAILPHWLWVLPLFSVCELLENPPVISAEIDFWTYVDWSLFAHLRVLYPLEACNPFPSLYNPIVTEQTAENVVLH